MEKEEMKTFMLRLLQKERAIWMVWEAQGNPSSAEYLEKVEDARRSFLEALGHD